MQGLILPAIFCAVIATAQTTPASPAPPSPVPASESASAPASPLASGTLILAEFSKSLDARKNRVGDEIEAKTSVDLLAHGKIVLPRNTKIIGHVTGVKLRSKDSPASELAITYDCILLKDGRKLPVQVTVQAIGRPLNSFFGAEDSEDESASTAPLRNSAPRATVPGLLPGSRFPATSREESGNATLPGHTADSRSVFPLEPTSQGAIGLKGLALTSAGPVATIGSTTQNVRVDSSSQLLLKAQ